jgi:TrmH family RNA methyltransferase
VPLFATSSYAGERVDGFARPWPCAWVFGHEGQGVAGDVAAHCRAMLRVPQPGGQESLNVAAAAAICLYESARQRGA